MINAASRYWKKSEHEETKSGVIRRPKFLGSPVICGSRNVKADKAKFTFR